MGDQKLPEIRVDSFGESACAGCRQLLCCKAELSSSPSLLVWNQWAKNTHTVPLRTYQCFHCGTVK